MSKLTSRWHIHTSQCIILRQGETSRMSHKSLCHHSSRFYINLQMFHDDINIVIILACTHVSLDTCKVTHVYHVYLLVCLKEWESQSVLCCSKTTWSWVFYKEGKKEAHSVHRDSSTQLVLISGESLVVDNIPRGNVWERQVWRSSDGVRRKQEGQRGQALCSSLITWSCGTNWSLGDASMLALLCLPWISLKFPRASSTALEAKLPASVLLGLGRHIQELSKPCIWAVFLIFDWGVPHRMEW